MAKFLDLSVNGIALGAVSGGTNTTQALLSTTASNALQLSGANTSTLCRLTGVDQPTNDTDAANRLYVQSYVLGQIRGLQMKQSVKLCSTTPVSLTSSTTTYNWVGPYAQAAVDPGNIVTRQFFPAAGGLAEATGQTPSPGIWQSTGKLTITFKWRYNTLVGCNPFSVNLGHSGVERQLFFTACPNGTNLSLECRRSGGVTAMFNSTLLPPDTDIYFWWSWDSTIHTSRWDVALLQGGVLVPVEPSTGAVSHSWTYTTGYGIGPDYLPGGGIPTTWTMSSFSAQGWGIPETWSSVRVQNKSYATIQDAFFGPPDPPGWASSPGIDGSIPVALDRVLLTAQVAGVENGIWQVDGTGSSLIRPVDYPVGASSAANFVFIDGPGTANDDQGWLCANLPGQDVVGADIPHWMRYTSSGGQVGSLTMGTDSITTASGTLSLLNNNLTTTGSVSSTAHTCGALSMQAGNIYDASGQINFSTDNLVTSGTVKPGTLSLAAGTITDTSGSITLGATNVATTGSMTAPHFLTVSDERLKEVTSDLEITPDIYAALRPVCFNWKATGLPDVGLIAQEVQAAAPHAVNKDTNSPEGYLYVDYAAIVPYALAIAKAATERVAALEARVVALEPMDPQ